MKHNRNTPSTLITIIAMALAYAAVHLFGFLLMAINTSSFNGTAITNTGLFFGLGIALIFPCAIWRKICFVVLSAFIYYGIYYAFMSNFYRGSSIPPSISLIMGAVLEYLNFALFFKGSKYINFRDFFSSIIIGSLTLLSIMQFSLKSYYFIVPAWFVVMALFLRFSYQGFVRTSSKDVEPFL